MQTARSPRRASVAVLMVLAVVLGAATLIAVPRNSEARVVRYNQWRGVANFICRSGNHCIIPVLGPRLRNGYRVKYWLINWQMGRSRGVSNVRVVVGGRLYFSGVPRHRSHLRLPASTRRIDVYVSGSGGAVGPVVSVR